MRGEVSNGMICSLQELGYADSVIPKENAEGIYYLPAEAEPGSPVFPYLDMDDHIIELSITPNRADALSMRGLLMKSVRSIAKHRSFLKFRLLKVK